MPPSATTYVGRLSTMTSSPDRKYEGYNATCDYTIAFSNVVVDTSVDVPNFAPSFLQNFSVFNTTSNKRIKVTGEIDAQDLNIVFMEHGAGTLGMTWEVDMQSQTAPLPMLPGDTLFITTTKGFSYRDTLLIDSKLLAVRRDEAHPSTFKLDQNIPNPFNPTTVISYQLPATGHATLKIFDVLGKEVVTLVDQEKPAGVYRETWDASRLASGVYFCRLTSGNFTQTRKLLLIK
jgi:Secretion system C-terminal sorting domain